MSPELVWPAAKRAPTSRPREELEGAITTEGLVWAATVTGTVGDVLGAERLGRDQADHPVGAVTAEIEQTRCLAAEHGEDGAAELCREAGRAAEKLAEPFATRLDRDEHHGRAPPPDGATLPVVDAKSPPSACRSRSTTIGLVDWSSSDPLSSRPRRLFSVRRTSPTRVGLPSCPPGARSELRRTETTDPRTVDHDRYLGRVLGRVGEPFRDAEHRGGRRARGRGRGSRSHSHCAAAVELEKPRTPETKATSSSSATCAPTWPVSASTELRPARTRSKGPSLRDRGRQRPSGSRACRSRRRRGP